jgi:hypothetical protein
MVTFSATEQVLLDRCLARLAEQVNAPLVMLTDVQGHLICYRGRLPAGQGTGLAALAAASFAAGEEMGRFLGLRRSFDQQLHEGAVANLYTLTVGPHLLLIVAFTQHTLLGLVRLFAGQAQKELFQIMDAAEQNGRPQSYSLQPNFAQTVRLKLDHLLQDE